jgi:hypothetical protein
MAVAQFQLLHQSWNCTRELHRLCENLLTPKDPKMDLRQRYGVRLLAAMNADHHECSGLTYCSALDRAGEAGRHLLVSRAGERSLPPYFLTLLQKS